MADGPKKKATVATPSSAYQRMYPRWRMIDVLLGGTEARIASGEEFLPQYDNESNKNYESRLQRATLLNMTEQTLDTIAGKPFREQVVLGDDVPSQIEELTEDVDMQGNNLHAFCRSWFREGWGKGLVGTATAKVQYLTGCTQFGILTRPQGEVSKVPDTVYLDWQRLEYCLEGNEWADVRKSTHTLRSNGAGQPPNGQPLNHPHP